MKTKEMIEIVNALLERVQNVENMEMSEAMKYFLMGRKSAFNELYGILANMQEDEE